MPQVLLVAALLVAGEVVAAAPDPFFGYGPSASYGLDRGVNYGQAISPPAYGAAYGAAYVGPNGQPLNFNNPTAANYYGQLYAGGSNPLPPTGLAETQQGNLQQQLSFLQPAPPSFDASSALPIQPSMPADTHVQQPSPIATNSALPPYQQFSQQPPPSTESVGALQFQQQMQQARQEEQLQNRMSQLQEQQKQQQKQQENLIKLLQEQQTSWKKANTEVEQEQQQMRGVMSAVLNATEMLSKAVKRSVSRELEMQAPVQALQTQTAQIQATMVQNLGRIEAEVEDTKAAAATAEAAAEQASVAARLQKLASGEVQSTAANNAGASIMAANSAAVATPANNQANGSPALSTWLPSQKLNSAVMPSWSWFGTANTAQAAGAGTPGVATPASSSFLSPSGRRAPNDYEDAVPIAK